MQAGAFKDHIVNSLQMVTWVQKYHDVEKIKGEKDSHGESHLTNTASRLKGTEEVSFPPAHGPREPSVEEVGLRLKYVPSRAKKSTGRRRGAGAL